MNDFSVTLPFSYEQIDKLAELNNTVKKSKITYLYSALPINCTEDNTGFEQNRGYYQDVKNLDDFMKYVKYAKSLGFDFIYLFNSSKGFQLDSPYFYKSIKRLRRLLDNLQELGCNKVKIGNTQILDLITVSYPEIEPILSTVLGYKDIVQYQRLKTRYPNIKTTVLVYDSNKDIPFIKAIQKIGFKVKLMVNEGCMTGCPYRHSHDLYPVYDVRNNSQIEEQWTLFQLYTFTSKCNEVVKDDFWKYAFTNNIIYPHQISNYNKFGVTDFKIAGRGEQSLKSGFQIDFIKNYLQYVDNPELSYDKPFLYFNRALWFEGSPYCKLKDTVGDVIDFLPRLDFFEKNGHDCSVKCGISCNYCEECVNKYVLTKTVDK